MVLLWTFIVHSVFLFSGQLLVEIACSLYSCTHTQGGGGGISDGGCGNRSCGPPCHSLTTTTVSSLLRPADDSLFSARLSREERGRRSPEDGASTCGTLELRWTAEGAVRESGQCAELCHGESGQWFSVTEWARDSVSGETQKKCCAVLARRVRHIPTM